MENFNPFIRPPQSLFIEITTECNLRCKHCHLWMTKEEEKESLTTREKSELIFQFYMLNPRGTVILTGGETMKKSDEFFTLSQRCRSLNLPCSFNSNATFINEDNLERLLFHGPNYIIVSLDSHIEKIHDHIRGVKGNYQHVTSTLKKLAALRSEKSLDKALLSKSNGRFPTIIQTNTVIFNENINYWADYIEFARNELRVDGVSFQMLGRTFSNKGKKDHFFENHFIKDIQHGQSVVDEIMSKYAEDPFVVTNKNDFEWMKLYMANPDFIGEQVCGSHERNIIVDQYGVVKLCFNMLDITDNRALGNARQTPLKELWASEFSNTARDIMSSCRMNCGMLSCHRKRSAG